MRAKVLCDPLVQYYRGLNWHRYNMSMWIDMACCFGKGRGSTETPSKLFANHNAQGQLTNHNTFRFLEGGPSSNPELIERFVPGWGERYCNNVNYVKNNAIFEPPSMRACSSNVPLNARMRRSSKCVWLCHICSRPHCHGTKTLIKLSFGKILCITNLYIIWLSINAIQWITAVYNLPVA